MRPVSVSVDVPQDRERVYAFLDVMTHHERFTDHMLRDWGVLGAGDRRPASARRRA